ncbi:antibiotic biosynthesis monooxygenase family protein [Novosphingobium sp. BL-8H]|uniref:putative quinol monooxygenase n=1 Tax=Novosphingobium sp. BL-8H TaxID=3127640 RepID=UPI003757AA2C
MNTLSAAVTALSLLSFTIGIATASAREPVDLDLGPAMVRMAELEIDPAQLDAYKTILAEEQEASVRSEPGVIMLHSVAIAEDPTKIRLLEVYASKSAYQSHIRSPHFLKYKTSTEKMVRSLRLVDMTPILLCAKSTSAPAGNAACLSSLK